MNAKKLLKEIKQKLNLKTDLQLKAEIGISQPTLIRWRRNGVNLSTKQISALIVKAIKRGKGNARKYSIKPIIEYYRQFLKQGEEVWWLDQEESKSTGLIIKLWHNLSLDTRKDYMLKAMILFPEIFSNHTDKFNRLAVWLVNMQGVVCPNIRDVFTAGGQGQLIWKKKTYSEIPKIVIKLTDSLPEIKDVLDNTDNDTLSQCWDIKLGNKMSNWIDLVIENTKHMKLKFNLKEYLTEN